MNAFDMWLTQSGTSDAMVARKLTESGLRVSRQAVNRWRSGQAQPRGKHLRALEALYGLGPSHFGAGEAVDPYGRDIDTTEAASEAV